MLSVSDLILQSDDHSRTSPGGIDGTCVDLANEYLRLCHGATHQWRTAAHWATAPIDGWASTVTLVADRAGLELPPHGTADAHAHTASPACILPYHCRTLSGPSLAQEGIPSCFPYPI